MKFFLAVLMAGLVVLPAFGATKTEFTMVNASEPRSLDPQLIDGVPERRISLALFEGLVTYDNKTGEARPGLAESWKIAKDGVTYTFKLRKAVWSDGTPIIAKTVVDSWLRELDPKTAAAVVDPVADAIAGGRDYQSGKAGPEAVQVRAVDDSTFQVKFNSPLPTLSMLAQPSFAVVPVHAIVQFGADWTKPENFVGNGPYKLETWVPQSKITVVPNPKYWDQKSVKLVRITFLAIEDNNTGYTMYQKGETDWIGTVPRDQIENAQLRKDFQNTLFLGTYYYRLNVTDGALKDPKVRRALALAFDRPALVKRVTQGGQLPAYSYSPKFSFYTPPTFASKDDAKAAQKLLADAGFPGGKGFPQLTILYNTAESHKKIAEYIQDQWKRNLGIEVELKNEDWKTYLEDTSKLNYQIARAAWYGDYNDPMTFLDMLVTGSENNNTGFSDPQYDALVAKAKTQPEGAERVKMLTELETILMAQLPVIPIYTYTSLNMIDLTKWDGWYGNLLDVHPWKNVGPRK